MKFQFQGREKSSNSDNDGQRGRGGDRGEESKILPDVLCEWSLNTFKFCG